MQLTHPAAAAARGPPASVLPPSTAVPSLTWTCGTTQWSTSARGACLTATGIAGTLHTSSGWTGWRVAAPQSALGTASRRGHAATEAGWQISCEPWTCGVCRCTGLICMHAGKDSPSMLLLAESKAAVASVVGPSNVHVAYCSACCGDTCLTLVTDTRAHACCTHHVNCCSTYA